MNGTEQADSTRPERTGSPAETKARVRVTQSITKYGLTLKGYVITMLIFPPAAMIIAWKLPRYPLAVRIPLVLLVVILPLFLTVVAGTGVGFMFGWL